MSRRDDFLARMYEQLWGNINRHLIVVWHSVSVVVGAFALLAFVEKKTLSLDVAASLLMFMAAWLIAHVLDASHWFNRNLVIIANIERQFLREEDLRHIHHYFAGHVSAKHVVRHLQIQLAFGIGVGLTILVHHFLMRVLPALQYRFLWEAEIAMPYIAALASIVYLSHFRRRTVNAQRELLEKEPGAQLSDGEVAREATANASHDPGHGVAP